MDAGCGSGLLTKLLAKKIPKGKVYAVDIDSNMVRQAKRNLKDLENVELVESVFTHSFIFAKSPQITQTISVQ